MNKFYTYVHCKPDGSPFYVGKGSLRRTRITGNRNVYHQRVVSKYGKDNIQVLVFLRASEESSFEFERFLIKTFRDLGFSLANHTDGGEGMSNPSEETRAKLSAAHKGKPFSKEHCAALSISNMGNKNGIGNKNGVGKSPWLGRKHSPESRAKMTAIRIGKKASAETRKKMSAAKIGNNNSHGMKAAIRARWIVDEEDVGCHA